MVASKLMFLLDDLLWVLTDSQLKAMMKYAESLSEAMEKSAQQRKSMAPEPVQVNCSGTHACCDSQQLQLIKIREEFYVGFYIVCVSWIADLSTALFTFSLTNNFPCKIDVTLPLF